MSNEPDLDDYIEPPPEAREAEQPGIEEAFERVDAILDKDGESILHTVAFFGSDDLYWYYIAIVEREYQGNNYLNERYVQLAKPGIDRDDSWKKNGINRRVTEHLHTAASVLAAAYSKIASQEAAFQSGLLDVEDIERTYYDAVTGEVEVPTEGDGRHRSKEGTTDE